MDATSIPVSTGPSAPASGDGELLQAVLYRAMREAVAVLDREVRDAAARESNLPAQYLPSELFARLSASLSAPLRNLNIAIWQKDWGPPWPNMETELPLWVDREARRAALDYRVKRDAWLAVIEVLDQWARGELELWYRRSDGALALVPPHVRNSLFLMLHTHTGEFVPMGQAPPSPDLRRYSQITVRPVKREPLLPFAPEMAPTASAEAAVAEAPARSGDKGGREYHPLYQLALAELNRWALAQQVVPTKRKLVRHLLDDWLPVQAAESPDERTVRNWVGNWIRQKRNQPESTG